VTNLIGFGESVAVSSLAQRDIPLAFTWRGRRYYIRSIEAYRKETCRRWNGVETRRFFQLRTVGGMRCLLTQDVARDTWRLEQVLVSPGGV
jgi:hypothetical protein